MATRPALSPAQAERAELLANFETYLLRQRGLSPRSIDHGRRFASRFLDHRFGDQMLDLAALNVRDVVAFMEHVLARHTTPYRDKTLATHLRSFFQYLFAQGLTTTNLSLCVPRVRTPWGARLPRYLSPEEVEGRDPLVLPLRCFDGTELASSLPTHSLNAEQAVREAERDVPRR